MENITEMTIGERRRMLNERKAALDKEYKEIESESKKLEMLEKQEKKQNAIKRIQFLRENRHIILSLIDHSKKDCSDEHPINGYAGEECGGGCPKCKLLEILNGCWEDGAFDVNFSVDIVSIDDI